MKNKFRFIIFGLYCLLAALVLCSYSSYAWYMNNKVSEKEFVYTTTEGHELTLDMSIYDEELAQYSEFSPVPVGAQAFDINNLMLGVIDNVAELSLSNVVYFRLTVPVTAGNDVFFKFSYDTVAYNVYNELGEVVTDETALNNLNTINEKYNGLLKYQFAISSDQNVDFTTLTYSEEVCIMDANSNNVTNTGETDYYVYIKFYPNLDAYIELADQFISLMPCYFDFNLLASFDVVLDMPEAISDISSGENNG